MEQIYHFSDQLGSVDCIPCLGENHSGRYSRDHIPTRALLNPPYPENLMDVGMCQECNSGFSKDEEYFAAFLASVISGSTEPDPLQFPTASRILAHNPRLRSRIDAARRVEATPGRDTLGCVDILVMMLVCQMLSCQQNSGTGFSISCVAAPACMSLRKKIASDLSRLCCGLTAPAPNGGCFRPNTGIGTVSINDSPVGLTKASGNRCFNISPATRTWNT